MLSATDKTNFNNLDTYAHQLKLFAPKMGKEASAEIAQLGTFVKDASKRIKNKDKNFSKKKQDNAIQRVDHVMARLSSLPKSIHHCSEKKEACRKDCIKLLEKIRHELRCCCEQLRNKLAEIDNTLQEKLPCTPPKPISEVPFVITESGKYCVTQDLSFLSNTGPAVTIAANDVEIDGNGFTLVIDPAINGIFGQNISNITIKNWEIQSSVVSSNANSNAFNFTDIQRLIFDNVVIKDTRRGILLVRPTDTQVLNCEFSHPAANGRGLQTQNSRGTVVENCNFLRAGNIHFFGGTDDRVAHINNCKFLNLNDLTTTQGILYQNSIAGGITENVHINNCTFTKQVQSIRIIGSGVIEPPKGILVENCTITQSLGVGIFMAANNAVIDNCVVESDPSSQVNCLQIGAAQVSNNVIVRNSVFSNPQADPVFDNILILNGNGVLIENCIADSNPSGVGVVGTKVANIHIGFTLGIISTPSNDVKISNCIVRNTAQVGIFAELGSKNVVIENTQVDGALEAGIMLNNVTTSRIKDSEVTNTLGGPGIHFINARRNVVDTTAVKNNTGDGILLDALSTVNTIKYSVFSANTLNGINNLGGTANEFYYNSSCNNNGTDCVGISPASIAQPPGAPATNGINVCCTSAP